MSSEKIALLIVAHGSTFPQSNHEVEHLVKRVREISTEYFFWVDVGFLELTEPRISQSIDSMVEKGATKIKVFPYFLAAGSHVSADVPAIIKAKQEQLDGERRTEKIEIELLDHLGLAEEMPDFLLDQVLKSH